MGNEASMHSGSHNSFGSSSLTKARKSYHDGSTFTKKYTLKQQLGSGGFATVFLVESKATGQHFAAKLIKKLRMSRNDYTYHQKLLKTEVSIMKSLKGTPGIATLHDVIDTKQDLVLILDYCRGGDLFDNIVQNHSYSEATAAKITREMLGILKVCHDRGVVHRDIKPENFLYRDFNCSELVLTDFGLACRAPEPGKVLRDLVGTPDYMAPEIMAGKGYTEKVDVFAVGCILYILLSGHMPFSGKTPEEIHMQVMHGQVDLQSEPWPSISDAAKSALTRMLVKDPSKRPSAASLAEEDPWIREGGVASFAPLKTFEDLRKNMLDFLRMDRLKKATLIGLSGMVEEGKLDDLKKAFEEYDVDKSGSISRGELDGVAKALGLSLGEEELDLFMVAYDYNGDGEISYTEFIAFSEATAKDATIENLRLLFEKYDMDSNDHLSGAEIRKIIEKSGEAISAKRLDTILKGLDKDGNGEIDFDEFCQMFLDM